MAWLFSLDDIPMMSIIAFVLAIAALICYFIWRLTARLPTRLRLLVRTFALAFVITPGLIGGSGEGGGGVFPVPVIFVFIVSIGGHDWEYLLYGAVLPVVCVWLVAYIISLVHNRHCKRKGSRVT
jgi:hypothetical protein